MRALLQSLERAAPEIRRPQLAEQLALLDAAVEREFPDPRELAIARTPDPLGLGAGTRDWL